MIKACNSAGDAQFRAGPFAAVEIPAQAHSQVLQFSYILVVQVFTHSRFESCVYLEMLDDNVTPGLHTLNAMVYAYCKLGKLVEADLYLGKIITAVVWFLTSVFIGSLCKRGRLEESQAFFDSLKEKGIQPTKVIYTALIDGYCKFWEVSDALSLFNRMLTELGYLPALGSCKWLICWLVDEESNEKANAFFCSMLHCGYNLDEVVWKLLLDGLVKRGHVNKSCQLHPETYSMLRN
ncbi:hypothetical protein M0R45_012214 [Rubus argutus]|uniref:Pentatricopeptide repeat-containing protein n=1 Tax=Rubus argutus TaxID=59490 RepID=A0AAW1YGR5_RUBAR